MERRTLKSLRAAAAVLALGAVPAGAKLSDVKTLQLFVNKPAMTAAADVEAETVRLFEERLPEVRVLKEFSELNLLVDFDERPGPGKDTVLYAHRMRVFGSGSDRIGLFEKVYWTKGLVGVVRKRDYDDEWRQNLARLVKDLDKSFDVESEFTGQVVGVSDGDTLSVLRGGQAGSLVTVRLHNVDAPEKDQKSGQQAKAFTTGLALGKEVTVRSEDVDRYGRVLGEVSLPDGRSLNRELLKAGWAWWYDRYSKDTALADLERAAAEAKKGLWVDPDPTPPWDFRKEHRR